MLAAETGDSDLQSWVHAQEAYFHFYEGIWSELLNRLSTPNY